jgi:hypothetical protein
VIDQGLHPVGCGCCQQASPLTPIYVVNRPGLSSIAYRIGTYGSFAQTMIDQISQDNTLDKWSTRTPDDDAIALLHLWALVADILTFYQERIANESFVRTAVLRESLVRIVRLLDYTPAPGLAATTELAFIVEPGKTVNVPAGLKVQSVPVQGQQPQKFEVTSKLEADALVNLLRIFPVPKDVNALALGSAEATVLGTPPPSLVPNARLALFDPTHLETKQVLTTRIRDTQLVVDWSPPVLEAGFTPLTASLAPYKRAMRLFGYNAPDKWIHLQLQSDQKTFLWTQDDLTAAVMFDPAENAIYLDSRYDDMKSGTLVLIVQPQATRLTTVVSASSEHNAIGPISDTVTKLTLGMGTIAGRRTSTADPSGARRIFVVADDGAVWTNNTSSGLWESRGGRFTALTASVDPSGRTNLFALGLDGAVWHTRPQSQAAWDSWARLGGSAVDIISVANQDGSLSVLTRGTDAALWLITQKKDGSWTQWQSLGGSLKELTATIDGGGLWHVFSVGLDGNASHISQGAPNSTWGSWTSLPTGRKFELVAAAANHDGSLTVFASDKTGLWFSSQQPNGTWSAWETLGGPHFVSIGAALVPGLPSAGYRGKIQIFGADQDGGYWHISQLNANDGWNKWEAHDAAGQAIDQVIAITTPLFVIATQRMRSGRLRWIQYSRWVFDLVTIQEPPIWPCKDVRTMQVYELSDPPLNLWNLGFADTITGNAVCILGTAPAALLPGRALLLDDAKGQPQLTKLLSVQGQDLDGDGDVDASVLTVADDLARSLDTWSAILYGNVAEATHGETVAKEVVGSGDGSAAFQTFKLAKAPVTHVPDPAAPAGAADTVQVSVSGIAWTHARTLYGRSADESIFTTAVQPDGSESVSFGDGVTGARVPTGQANVTAMYRKGLGPDGNVPRATLTTLLDRPLGLKSVTNPGPAYGGADPASAGDIRIAAPSSVRTFDRVVALADFESAALEYAGVSRALARMVWDGDDESVHLAVTGPGGHPLSDPVKSALAAYLDARRDPNRKLVLEDVARIPIQVAATVRGVTGQPSDQVTAAASAALAAGLSFDQLTVGESIPLSKVYTLLQNVNGVLSAEITALNFKRASDAASHNAGNAAVQDVLAIHPDEIAYLEDPTTDAVVVSWGTA